MLLKFIKVFVSKKPPFCRATLERYKMDYHYWDSENYAIIPGFSTYCVTDDGKVFNVKTGREMVLSPTLQGDLSVGMMKEGIQYRRSVKVLVAEMFVDGQTPVFNTPMLLDGDKHNLRADNIVWRPRWFAVKYARQFENPYPDYYYYGPIFDVVSSTQYNSILEAAMLNGLLCNDIYYSITNETHVFPSGERFVLI